MAERGAMQVVGAAVRRNAAGLAAFTVVFSCLTAWWLAFFPGTFSADSMFQYHEALGTELTNASPYLYAAFMRLLLHLWDSPAVVPLAQCLMLSVLVGVGVEWMRRRHAPGIVLVGTVAYFVLIPMFGIYSVTVWKDVPFAYLSAAALIAVFVSVVQRPRSVRAAVLAGVLVAAVVLVRFNGVGLAVAALALALFSRRLDPKRALALVLSAVVTYAALGVGLPALLDVRPAPLMQEGLYVRLVGAVYADDDEVLTSEQRVVFSEVMPEEKWEALYSPMSVDGLFYLGMFDHLDIDSVFEPMYPDDARVERFHDEAVRAALANPDAVLEDKVLSTAHLMGLYGSSYKFHLFIEAAPSPDSVVTADPKLPRVRPLLESWLYATAAHTSEGISSEATTLSVALNALLWTAAVPTAVYLYLAFRGLRRGAPVSGGVAFVVLANLALVLAVVPAVSFRYVYWLYPALPFVLAMGPIERRIRGWERGPGEAARADVPLKVAVVYSGARLFGGIETYLGNLFTEAPAKGIEPALFSMGEWELSHRVSDDGGEVHLLSSARMRPGTVGDMVKLLRAGGFDLVMTQGTVSNLYGRLAARAAGLPVVTVVHSLPRADYPSPVVRALYVLVDRCLRGVTDRYIAVSEHISGALVASGIDAGRIAVVPNGVVTTAPPAVCDHGPKDGPVVVGSVGRLQPVKNYPALIEALASLTGFDWRLTLFGEGPERAAIEGCAFELGVADRVTVAGWQSDLCSALGSLDVYVQPSLSEGFGLAVVEAMAEGIPVVVTPVGGMAEIVEDGVTGVVTSGTDAASIAEGLGRLMGDAELMRRCGHAGAHHVCASYSVEAWISSTARELRSTVAKSPLD